MPTEVKHDDSINLYARVSSNDQKQDLERQLERLKAFSAKLGRPIKQELKEIGSGLNGKRPKLINLLEGTGDIVIEHKDRLCRFGYDYIEAALKAQNRKIIVMNETENKLDLVQDFIDVVTSMCARIYGTRSAKNRANRAIEAAQKD